MLKWVFTTGLCTFLLFGGQAQLKRFYSLGDVQSFDTVDFTLTATSGISFLRHVDGGNPLAIYGNPDLNKINPSFDAKVVNRKCIASLSLDEFRTSGLGDGLAYAFGGAKEKKEEDPNYWKFLLNNQKVYNLNLNYGIGSSDIDLGGTKCSSLKVQTGNAEVVVAYGRERANLITMDTFFLKVDFGSIKALNLEKSRAENIIAEIGFGQAELDLGQLNKNGCNVRAAVGAGTLDICIPKQVPIIIEIKDSPFCSIDMHKDFEEVETNVYVNRQYASDADNLISFKIDVAIGNVKFDYSLSR
ncbi:MAG: hypothetical protein JXQ90_16130 [Cyclobacteriaceae bacterium]